MNNSKEFVKNFMEKLDNGQLKKDIEPQSNDGVELTPQLIEQKNANFLNAMKFVNQLTDIPYNGDNINSRD